MPLPPVFIPMDPSSPDIIDDFEEYEVQEIFGLKDEVNDNPIPCKVEGIFRSGSYAAIGVSTQGAWCLPDFQICPI